VEGRDEGPLTAPARDMGTFKKNQWKKMPLNADDADQGRIARIKQAKVFLLYPR
jgi:hypothetical protein